MGQDFWPQLGGNMFNGGDKKPKPGGNNRKNSSPQKSPVRKTGLNAEKLTNTSPWLNKKNAPSGEKKETEQRSGGSGSNPNSNPNSSSNSNKNFVAPMPQVQYVHVLNLPGQPNGQQSPGMALLFSVLGLALSMLRAKILMRLVVGTASKSEKPSRWRKKYLEQTPVTFQGVAGEEEEARGARVRGPAEEPLPLQEAWRSHPSWRPADRTARDWQDAHGQGRGGRGGRAVLLRGGLGLRGAVRGRGRGAGARALPRGPAPRALHRVHRRDRRRGQA
ncbi:unnamed protein product, partial [Heterosigma akashiwo]